MDAMEAATLTQLYLERNKIGDDGVGILVDALQNNKSLTTLNLKRNDEISDQGRLKLLKLVNDVSSIKATLQSNHTLRKLLVEYIDIDPSTDSELGEIIQRQIDVATEINRNSGSDTELAGREKCIQTQLNSETRAELAALQGINHSVYSEIDPIHLPDVLSLVDQHHGQGELYVALKSSIAGVISIVNLKKCMQQEKEYHAAKAAKHAAIAAEHRAKVEEIDAKLATIDQAAEANQDGGDSQSNKRRRT